MKGDMTKKGYHTILVRDPQYHTLLERQYHTESMADVVQRLLDQPYTWQRFLRDLARLRR